MILATLAIASAAIWTYLIAARGDFWRAAERDTRFAPDGMPAPAVWPSVTAVVPARNEADVIAQSIGSLLGQTYPGPFRVVLVDDGSDDGTGEIAADTAWRMGRAGQLAVIRGAELPSGWTGKLYAMSQGFRSALATGEADYVLFTDADIGYSDPGAVERLVRGAETRGTVLTSLMVKLRCDSFAEKLLIPAFIFFFQKLYPFRWVNMPCSKVAAAAGGCMLIRADALVRAGGVEAIRGSLIDDCAMGALMKSQGPVFLGLTEAVESIRPYDDFGHIRRMVSRSAYAELDYSPLKLLGAVLGMIVTYVTPPALALLAPGWPGFVGAAVWAAMAISFQPVLKLYGRSPAWGVALPFIALLYLGFTMDSAVQHWRGKGGAWKGRYQAAAGGTGA
ncbi:glycosyltransferase [Terrihabitans rhizophilus]|uniref:Glycosyltransferase n=1 Tax=Terrihabitans rhizophilus TaxID=3092662 RepID=A0ABU4RJU1_9HYPH|nr:glycosyltransferase [Terrihabitans sp. PJ23]MDX6804468.1 glycosyltransferase [Terrihabitans sp. PJ23]